jgi:amidohydrolase family protein
VPSPTRIIAGLISKVGGDRGLRLAQTARRLTRDLVKPLPRLDSYDPQSTIVLRETHISSASCPALDFHNHLGRWLTRTWVVPDVSALVHLMDLCNIELIVNADGRWGVELEANLNRYDRQFPGRFATFCHLDWGETAREGFGERMAQRLLEDFESGAHGLKVWKDLGLSVRDCAGDRLLPDDERLKPVWDVCARAHRPVLIHTGDPVAFFRPVDNRNERIEELRRFPKLSQAGKGVAFEDLAASFERLLAQNPETTFVGAHLGGHAEDLGRIAGLLERYPNFHVDLAARMSELGRQPRAAATLIRRYPDRVLFGTDIYPPRENEYRLWFRFLETDDEYFPYSASGQGSGRWRIYGLHLPADVLTRVYRDNARRLLGLDVANG